MSQASFRPVRVARRTAIAGDVVRLDLAAPAAMVDAHVAAGQFSMLRTEPEGPEAPFALWTAPHERAFTVLVRATEPPSTVLVGLGPGDVVHASPPLGRGFDLAAARGGDVLFVGTGTGVAPIRAAVEAVLQERDAYGALRVVLGLRGPEGLLPPEDLARWADRGVAVELTTSRHASPGAARGRVHALLDADATGLGGTIVAAGQPELLDTLRARAAQSGGARVLDNLSL